MDIVKTVEETLNVLRKHIAKLEEKANDTLPTNMKVEFIPAFSAPYMETVFTVINGYYGNSGMAKTEDQIDKCVTKHEAGIAEYLDKIEAIHLKNIPAIENNVKLRAKLSFIMDAAGIPTSYTTFELPSARARTKKSVYHTAGYLGDINRNVIIQDSYESYKNAATKSIEVVKEEARKRKAKIAAEVREKEKEELKKSKEKLLVHLRIKYELEYDVDSDEIMDAILDKNKYLRLAHYLYKNREDWNDGSSYAQCGLNGFNAVTKEDKEIEKQIQAAIDDWDADGRVFRDMEYGYGHLYNLASGIDNDLYKDYEKLKEYIDESSY